MALAFLFFLEISGTTLLPSLGFHIFFLALSFLFVFSGQTLCGNSNVLRLCVSPPFVLLFFTLCTSSVCTHLISVFRRRVFSFDIHASNLFGFLLWCPHCCVSYFFSLIFQLFYATNLVAYVEKLLCLHLFLCFHPDGCQSEVCHLMK